MKKILLSTALSLVLVAPALAEEVLYETQEQAEMAKADAEAARATAEGAVQTQADTLEVVVEESGVVRSKVEAVAEPVAEMEAVKEVEIVVERKAPVPPPAVEEEPTEVVMSGVEEESDSEQEAAPQMQHANWGYNGAQAAPYWGTLDSAYETCVSGQKQSPINIAKFLQEDVPDLQVSYNPSPLSVLNNGHTIQVNYAPGSAVSVDGMNYKLLQIHFHTPSEHYLDGAPYPMEAHFVHSANDGTLAIIGVMMKIGKHNPTIEGIWLNTPINAGASKTIDSVEISAADLLPASLDHYRYEGSMTVPPCSEGVQWHVLKDPIDLSEGQLKAFQALFPVNARPVQPLNDRVVTGD